ncbi:MAG: transglycosylase domain-containing protein [Eubacterium sp.]|nr:transglycosylase domain-containing protein [Eubacterium sp.]
MDEVVKYDLPPQKKRRKKVKKHRKFWLVFKIIILVILLSILGVGLFLYFKYGDMIFSMQDEAKVLVDASTPETFRASETSIAYDNKGKQIAVLKGEKDSYYMTIDKIPQYVKDAFIVTEDKKFYSHNGIDVGGIIRAGLAYIRNNGTATQGASTITQQLARGTFLSTEKTVERKIKEIFIAMEMEKKYTKDQIFEFYLNSIYFMNGYYGIEAAAKGYFSKSCTELTLGEITFLCAIPNSPSRYDPLRRYKNTITRKNRILDQMLADGVINRIEYDEAYAQKIVLNVQEVKKRDYIETFVTYCAIRALMKKNGFEFRYSFIDNDDKAQYDEIYETEYALAEQKLKNNGLRIYTSIDLPTQRALQKAINDNLKPFKEKTKKGVYKMQGSGTCIDNDTGRVVAIVGGRSQQNDGYTLNRAYQAFRQPGSSIKPLVVYTPSLERGKTRYTTVNDHKFEDGPSNSSGSYYGNVSIEFAVQKSLNTVAWQLFEELTPEVGLQYLLEMDFSHIVKSDYYLSASLGGLTYGCSTLEMASAYATLGNGGRYREPTCIVTIKDSEGNELVGNEISQKYVYKHESADEMLDILQGVFKSGTAAGHSLENDMPCAGKTGTTNDKKDGWFCGLTPYYTASIWIGYDSPRRVEDLYGSTYPLVTWQQFMNEIHKDLKPKDFDISKAVIKKRDVTPEPAAPVASVKPPKNIDEDPADAEEEEEEIPIEEEEPVEEEVEPVEEATPEPEQPVDEDPADGGENVDVDPNDE